ncbi:hypothetical protein FKR81_31090 [Lentzea tibetensis]|uniref:Uncharacterized protein n=1 Tax=Lentzea tibetensis TaxID=2591470 RepID=A0A563ELB9_9PSEU|nr:hypothetical protein [Lentzea tibetensis]TWP47787.1 hypothetical protein FKR81_31090 [Lentzea tibetensis]
MPRAVLNTQEQLAAEVARSTSDTVDATVRDLRVAPRCPDVDPARLKVGRAGVALVDGATRAPISAVGEALPLDKLPPTTDVSVTPLRDKDFRLLVAVEAPDGRLLVASVPVELPFAPLDSRRAEGLVLLDRSGVVAKRGTAVPPEDQPLLEIAANEPSIGSRAGQVTVVGHAPVTSTHLTRFTVVSATKAVKEGLVAEWPGLVPSTAARTSVASRPTRTTSARCAPCWSNWSRRTATAPSRSSTGPGRPC